MFLLAIIIFGEHQGHAYRNALIRRGVIDKEYYESPYYAVQGWTNTLKKMNIDCDIVFLGNSITAGSDFQTFFPNKQIVNLGYSGDFIPGMINRIEMVKAVKPEKIFVMAGTNDIGFISIDKYVERYDSLITGLQRSIPESKIYIQSVLPINHEMASSYASNEKISQANKEIEKLAKAKNCVFINLYDLYVMDGEMNKELTRDGAHLKPEAYNIWAQAIEKYIYGN